MTDLEHKLTINKLTLVKKYNIQELYEKLNVLNGDIITSLFICNEEKKKKPYIISRYIGVMLDNTTRATRSNIEELKKDSSNRYVDVPDVFNFLSYYPFAVLDDYKDRKNILLYHGNKPNMVDSTSTTFYQKYPTNRFEAIHCFRKLFPELHLIFFGSASNKDDKLAYDLKTNIKNISVFIYLDSVEKKERRKDFSRLQKYVYYTNYYQLLYYCYKLNLTSRLDAINYLQLTANNKNLSETELKDIDHYLELMGYNDNDDIISPVSQN